MPPAILTFAILFSFNRCINGEGLTSVSTGSLPSPSASSSSPAFSFEPSNVQKVRLNQSDGKSDDLFAVNIPEKYSNKAFYPHLKFINDSSEIPDDGRIAEDGTLISGVASRFGKRSARSYQYQYQYPPNRIGWSSSYQGSGRRFNKYYPSPIRYHPNGIDTYSDGSASSSSWGGKWLNQLKRRTSMMTSPGTATMDKQQMQMMDEGTADEPDMAGTFVGGWGQGYGKSKVNKSAVGLLGFLSLLSLIQNVLNQTLPMRLNVRRGRRRRDVSDLLANPNQFGEDEGINDDDNWNEVVKETTLVVPIVLPMLNAANWAKAGDIQVECTLQPICIGNQALVETLGERGKVVGRIISESLSKTLLQAGNRWKIHDWGLTGKITRAGMAGRSFRNCMSLYSSCPELSEFTKLHISQFYKAVLSNHR